MTIVLKKLPRTCNFCDDILIHSRTYEEHVEDVNNVLKRLNEYNLKITIKKCQWFQHEVKFLGFLVNGEGIRSNPEKVAVVKDWKEPQSKKVLLRFLGFTKFYHNFIDSLSRKAKPLFPAINIEDTDKDSVKKWGTFLNRTVPMIHARAINNIKKAQEHQQKQYDRNGRIQDVYQTGDLVARKNVKTGGFPKERWTGPWVIVKATNKENTAYQIYNKRTPKHISKANIGDLRKWYSQ